MELDPPDEFFELTAEDLQRMQAQAAAKRKVRMHQAARRHCIAQHAAAWQAWLGLRSHTAVTSGSLLSTPDHHIACPLVPLTLAAAGALRRQSLCSKLEPHARLKALHAPPPWGLSGERQCVGPLTTAVHFSHRIGSRPAAATMR